MKNLIILAVFLVSFLAFTSTVNAQDNQFGASFVFNRSDAKVSSDNAVGAQAFYIRNFTVKVPFTVIETFGGWSGQAFPNGSGRLLRNDLKARVPVGLSLNFMGSPSEFYVTPLIRLENQSVNGSTRTIFSPAVGLGFKTGDVYTEYHYVVRTNQAATQGHLVNIEWYRPLPGASDKWKLVTGASGYTASFNPLGVPPGVNPTTGVYEAKFFVGVSRKY